MAKSNRKYVVVRTYSAGVHCGELVERNGKEVRLVDARRIWSWVGAYTLHEIAVNGPGAGSKISAKVSEIDLTEAIEVLVCSDEAKSVLESAQWGK